MKRGGGAAVCLVALLLLLPGLAFALLQSSEAKVGFTCIGPGGLHVEGTGGELQVEDKGDVLLVTVPLTAITTGIGLRDTHMREKYLETPKYPTAELSVPRAGLKFPPEGETADGSAPGTLTLHGKSQPVSFHYRAVHKGKAYEVQADFHLNMNDFGIVTPSYLGITVKPGVDVTVSFRLLET
jgi:polyisoprenoid-binding protein YceI